MTTFVKTYTAEGAEIFINIEHITAFSVLTDGTGVITVLGQEPLETNKQQTKRIVEAIGG